jgi:chemotaxis protein methyltransferase CheR
LPIFSKIFAKKGFPIPDMTKEKEDILTTIEEIIRSETGIVIVNERKIDLEIVLNSRLIFHKMKPDQYIDFVRKNYNELIFLASCFTIQETSFYRYKAHFDRLKIQILPEIISRKENNKTIRILSAGSATGEEPYTLAMIINDVLGDTKQWKINIVGTDINENALAIAKEGMYSKYKLRNIDSWYVDKYFTKIKGGSESKSDNNYNTIYRLNDAIKSMVEFRHCNLIREPFELATLHDFDVILCENVIIYFCLESTQRLIKNFYDILAPNGYLFLGYSENLSIVRHKFTLSWWNESYAYVKEPGTAESAPIYEAPATPGLTTEPTIIPGSLSYESYEEMITLAIRNYKEGLLPNVIQLVQEIEKGDFKVDETFYVLKAEYFFDKHDFMNAANECRKAIGMNPYFVDAHVLLGVIYLNLEMLESALFELRTALYIDKNSIIGNYYFAIYNKKIDSQSVYMTYLDIARRQLNESGGVLKSKVYPINLATYNEIQGDILNIA